MRHIWREPCRVARMRSGERAGGICTFAPDSPTQAASIQCALGKPVSAQTLIERPAGCVHSGSIPQRLTGLGMQVGITKSAAVRFPFFWLHGSQARVKIIYSHRPAAAPGKEMPDLERHIVSAAINAFVSPFLQHEPGPILIACA